MLKNKTTTFAGSCLALLAQGLLPGALPTAQAQAAPSAEPTLGEVTVHGVADVARAGLFGDRKVQDTPFSVTPFTDALIRDQQARRLGDLVSNDASVRSAGTQNSESESFLVRGLTLLANEVAFDGLYGLQQVRRSGVGYAERVEIFKGPNAVINGISPFGSFGGVINIVPKRAGAEPVTDVLLDYASRRTVGAQVDVGRRFGPERALGVRLNAAAQGGETAIRDSHSDFGAADLALDWRSGAVRLTADLGAQKDDFKANQQPFSIAPGVPVPDAPDGSLNLSQTWGRSKTDDVRAVLGVQVDVAKDWTVSARYGQLRHTEDFRTPTGLTLVNAAGDFTFRAIGSPAVFKTRTGDVGLRGRFTTGPVRHDLAVNATYYNADNQFAFLIFGPVQNSNLYNPTAIARPDFSATPTESRPGNERTFRTLAVADTLAMAGDALQLTLGLRHQSIDVTNFVNLSGNANGVVSSVIDQSKTSPVAAVLFKPSAQWSLYANASEGLAPGPQAPGGTANVGTVLPPIEARSYEVGAKADFGRFGATAAAFQTTQQVGITNPLTNVFGADGEVRVRGAELSVFGTPWHGLQVVGGLTWLDPAQVKTTGGINDGKNAVGIPEALASLYAEWQTPFARGLRLTGRLLYTGKQFVDAGNTQSIPDWTRVDLGLKAALPNAPVTLRATVENVADKKFWAAARNGSLARGGPRTLLASAEIAF